MFISLTNIEKLGNNFEQEDKTVWSLSNKTLERRTVLAMTRNVISLMRY